MLYRKGIGGRVALTDGFVRVLRLPVPGSSLYQGEFSVKPNRFISRLQLLLVFPVGIRFIICIHRWVGVIVFLIPVCQPHKGILCGTGDLFDNGFAARQRTGFAVLIPPVPDQLIDRS